MEKRPKMKKKLYIARFCRVFGCQSIENTAKTSVLDWRYSKKRVNLPYAWLETLQKHCQKQCFWKDLLPLWQKTCKLPSVWLETLEKHCQKQCFGRISYLKSPHGGKPPLAPLTDRNKPAVWAATPREAGWIFNNNLLVVSSNSWKVAFFWQHHKLIAHLKSLIAIYYWFQRETDKMRSSKWQNLC